MMDASHSAASDPHILFASAHASACFALACLEPAGPHLRARSSFVDPFGRPMHWHDFGDLEGPGWAANAVGGAHLLYRWGRFTGSPVFSQAALQLLDHVLADGFVQPDGLVWPYYDLARRRFCLNYSHGDAWLCPGSLAKIGVQLLEFAEDLEAEAGEQRRARRTRAVAEGLAAWLERRLPFLPDGWAPLRITRSGEPYPLDPSGKPDPIYDHSADGLFLLQLWAQTGRLEPARRLGDAFVLAGGYWGSINHDTFDSHENVAYAVAFRALRQVCDRLERPAWRDFAYRAALPAMLAYRMRRDEHGVATRGLFWMEPSWDTAYLWENAEVAQAFLEAWAERGDPAHLEIALGTLRAIARHHTGELGFLSEGIDWNNHVSQRHHVGLDYYGAIRYTEPLLNNLHLLLPTLTCFEGRATPALLAAFDLPAAGAQPRLAVQLLKARQQPAGPAPLRQARYLLRLYHPTLATDSGVEAVLSFAGRAGLDGVLLFEASFDTDPALLPLAVLERRFERLRQIVPRFRAAGLEVHINVMITLGHVDAGGGQPEQFDFQFMVDETGAVSRSTACPLDPRFLDYAGQIYRWAADCAAQAIWVDDDVRFLGHDLTEMTCFCPLHLAEMTRRTGREWSRAGLAAALRDDALPELRRAWFSLQEEAILRLAERVEQEVHALAPAVQLGLMSVGSQIHAGEGRQTDRLLRALAGPIARPLLRPGSGFWHDAEPAAVLVKTSEVARQIGFLGRDVRLVAEIENHPYSPFQKARRVLALELALDVLAGLPELSLNLFSGSQPFSEYNDPAEMADFLHGFKPFLSALAQARAGKLPSGVGVEASEEVARRMPLRGRPLLAWAEPRPWEVLLARLGLPVGPAQGRPHLLTGEVAHTLGQMAIEMLLQEGVVLTPSAARGLLELGWGGRLGVEEVQPLLGANELFTSDPLNGVFGGICLPVRHYAGQLGPHSYRLVGGAAARPLSRWQDVSAADRGLAGAALELADGCRLGLLPFEPLSPALPLLHPARREAWGALLAWVDRQELPCRVVAGVNLAPQVYVDPETGEWLLALANLSADDQRGMVAGPILPEGQAVERLQPDGSWAQEAWGAPIQVPGWSLAAWKGRGTWVGKID